MQSVGDIIQSEKFKENLSGIFRINTKDLKEKGFLRFPLQLFDSLLFSHNLTKRQLLIILTIIRFSIGCRRSVAILKPADFQLVGIHLSDIVKELKELSNMNLIGWDRDNEKMWITQILLSELPSTKQEKLSKLLTKNLAKHQRKSRHFTNSVTQQDQTGKGTSTTDRYGKINIDSSNRYK